MGIVTERGQILTVLLYRLYNLPLFYNNRHGFSITYDSFEYFRFPDREDVTPKIRYIPNRTIRT